MDTTLKTTRTVVLDFDQAIKTGMCRDQDMNKHVVRGHGDQLLITYCDALEGQEFCFDHLGRQMGGTFKKTRLVEPARVEVKLLPYLIYDESLMVVVDQANGVMDGMAKAQARQDKDVKCINVTHPGNRAVLEKLGITRTRWFEAV